MPKFKLLFLLLIFHFNAFAQGSYLKVEGFSEEVKQKKVYTNIPFDSAINRIVIKGIESFENTSKNVLWQRFYNWYLKRIHNLAEEWSNDKKVRIMSIIVLQEIDSSANEKAKLSFLVKIDRNKLRKDNSFRKDLDGFETFTMTFWFKDSRVKYECAEYYHTAFGVGSINTEKTVYETEKFSIVRKKIWDQFKLENINFSQALLEEIFDFVRETIKKDMEDW